MNESFLKTIFLRFETKSWLPKANIVLFFTKISQEFPAIIVYNEQRDC